MRCVAPFEKRRRDEWGGVSSDEHCPRRGSAVCREPERGRSCTARDARAATVGWRPR